MFNVSIYEKNWTDLVFEGKNQQYGAYVLRRENERTTLISLFLGLLLFTSAILIFSFVNSLSKGDTVVTPDEIPNVIKVTNWTQPVEKKKDALPLVEKKSQETKHIDKSQAVGLCEAYAKKHAARPSTVDFSRFMDIAVTEHPNGRTRVTSTFTAKNSFNLEVKFNISCLLDASGLIEANINEAK